MLESQRAIGEKDHFRLRALENHDRSYKLMMPAL